MVEYKLITFIFLTNAFKLIFPQETSLCQTPNGVLGTCVSIKSCASLINLLRTQSDKPEVRNFLRKSACGYSGNVPNVCCPNSKPNSSITSPVNEVTTQNVVQPSGSGRGFAQLPRPPNCGFSNATNTKVVGGIDAVLGEFPWMTALGFRNQNNPNQPKWLCGGNLITEKHVLTAGHCVYNRNDLYLVRLGELDLYSDSDGANPEDIQIVNKRVHEDYNPVSHTNDIAILTLAHPPTSSQVWPICLPIDEPLRSKNFVKFNLFVSGWGALYFNGPSSSSLQTTTLPVVSKEQCQQAFAGFRTVIDDRVLCAGYVRGGKDACQGDSGGPLMYGKPEKTHLRFYQLGIVSYGFRCAEAGYPGVYTRVTAFVDWIQRNLD